MYLFFKELSEVMTDGTGVSLTVHRLNGSLTVSVFPKVKGLKDDAKNHLQPIVLTGAPEELDAGFFDAVRQPIQKATGLLSGMKSFEKSLARMEAERKEAQEQKRTADKKADERKSKYDKLITRAETQEKEVKNDAALQSLREARTMADGENIAKTDARIEELKAKCLQTSLF
jgi:PRTRC genetic system protein E